MHPALAVFLLLLDQPRNVPEFTSVHVAAGIQAKVTIGDRSVSVRAEDRVVPLVRTEVKDGQLWVGFEPHTSINSHQPVEVTIRAPKIEELGVSGGAGIDASLGSRETLRLGASGGGHIHVSATARQLDAQGSGGSVFTIEGRAAELKVQLSGGSVLKGGLSASSLEIHGSGGADARVDVDGPVRGALSGGSTARVGPKAKVDVQTSGGSEVLR